MPPRKLMIVLGLCALVAFGTASMWPGLGANVITYVRHDNIYSRSLASQAIGPEGMGALIFGAPQTGVSAAEIAARLELPAAFRNRKVRALAPEELADYPVRMVLLFNAGVPDDAVACTAPETIGAGVRDGALSVFAFLCLKDEAIARAALRNDAITGIDHPEFTSAMRQLFLALLPRETESDRDRREGGLVP